MRIKTVLIALFCIILIGNSAVSANFTTEYTQTIENKDSKAKFLPLNEGGLPDLISSEFLAAWGFKKSLHNCNGTFIVCSVTNIGKTYLSEVRIQCTIAFFADEEVTPFGEFTVGPLFDPYTWSKGATLTAHCFVKREVKPERVTAKVDFYNIISESNENNNEKTTSVPLSITIEGTVLKRENGELIPVKDARVISDLSTKTDENGQYSVGAIPREPFEEPDTFDVEVHKDFPDLEKTTSPVLPGGKTQLDFIFSPAPSKPSKPSGKTGIKMNKEYTFSTTSTEPEGEEVYYKWDWGDGTNSGWIGPYVSGEQCTASHIWNKPAISKISVCARDPGGALSKKTFLNIIVTRTKTRNYPFTNFFNLIQNFPNLLILLKLFF
ncbi:MAG: PKD domain-containing protein [Thermoplasmatales archaeon]|nr:MAG: PKD domain-containing protein [Thermoplasmatales archaeon]